MKRPSKQAIILVIICVVISLIGLVIVQINWLKSAIIVNEQRFNDKVATSITRVSQEYGTFLQQELNAINSHLKDEERKKKFEDQFDSILTAEFNRANLNQEFEFGLINQQGQLVAGKINEINYENCESFPYFCNYTLSVNFPNKEAALLTELSKTLAPSILFILILVGAFALIIFTLSQQKKISEIKNEFINNLTHEFKTPLSTISLASKVLKKEKYKISADKTGEYLNIITNESLRLENQIDKILQIAKLDSGNFTIEKREVNIHSIISSVVESLKPLVMQMKGNIQLELKAIKPVVMADEIHISNSIYNLLDNAIKYSQEKPEIHILTQETDEGISITVKDNGIGIRKDSQKLIFDKFYRENTGNVHNSKGFGLGLSYVKNIIEAHKGTIKLRSKHNHGSEFELLIPST